MNERGRSQYAHRLQLEQAQHILGNKSCLIWLMSRVEHERVAKMKTVSWVGVRSCTMLTMDILSSKQGFSRHVQEKESL